MQTLEVSCAENRCSCPSQVVADGGANWGLIISSAGFQKGAYTAAQYSNVRLANWQEFQALFEERWTRKFFVPAIRKEADPLVDYTEPINSRIFRKAAALDRKKHARFLKLREVYSDLAFLGLLMSVGRGITHAPPGLPLEASLPPGEAEDLARLPSELLKATGWREFLEVYAYHVRAALAEFDEVFGGRV